MNKLTPTKRAAVLTALVEGNSIRSTVRMTGVAKNTIVRLLKDAGEACAAYQDQAIRNVACRRIQCDEIWSFVYGKIEISRVRFVSRRRSSWAACGRGPRSTPIQS
jgi:hypothetical protein